MKAKLDSHMGTMTSTGVCRDRVLGVYVRGLQGLYSKWNIPLYCVNICRCAWFSKEVDWPMVEQDKVRRENQTKDWDEDG